MKNKTSNKKILIIGIHGPYEPWLSIVKNGQLETWSQNNIDDVHIVHAMGNPVGGGLHEIGEYLYSLKWSENKFVGFLALLLDKIIKKMIGNKLFDISISRELKSNCEMWQVDMPDFSLLMGNKMLSVIKFAQENYDFEYLVTTISSSYVNIKNLKDFIKDKQPYQNLSGRFVDVGDEHFQQGAFRLYSRDVVDYIVNNRKRYNHSAPEDVAMGRLVNGGAFKEYEMKNSTVNSVESAKKINISDIQEDVFIRCKGASVLGNKLRFDVEIQKIIHDKIVNQQS